MVTMRISRLPKTNIAKVAVLIGVLLSVFLTTRVAAYQGYGDGGYGDCAYAVGCVVPPVDPPIVPSPDVLPSTQVPVDPTPANPQEGRVFSVNITDGQEFRGTAYKVIITPNFSHTAIARIALLQDDVVVGEVSNIADESYYIDWAIPEAGSYVVSILMHLNDGGVIRQDFFVSVAGVVSDEETENLGEVVSSKDQQNGSWISRVIQSIATFFEDIINATPTAVAYSAPYLFLGVLGAIIGVLLLQTRNQFAHIIALLRLLEKDRLLAEEKTTFIMLVSHHLRTPLTILRNTLDLYGAENANDKYVKVAQDGVFALQKKSESILKRVAENKHLKDIELPNVIQIRQRLYYSWRVITPAVLSVVVIVVLNVVYITAEKTRLIIPNILVQAVILIAVLIAGYTLIQRYQQRKKELAHASRQREYEEALDKARNKFIMQVAQEITPVLATTKDAYKNLKTTENLAGVEEAFTRLDTMISRFVLAAELERGKIAATTNLLDVKPVAEKVIVAAEDRQHKRKLRVNTSLEPAITETNEFLLRYVVTALYDNAIRYANEGTDITANLSSGSDHHTFTIENQGKGIPKEKLAMLFKPFSTSEGVRVFDNTSMGLNLYLSRLIMRYLNGDIALQSQSSEKTTATIIIAK